MAYYKADAAIVEKLRAEIESLGMPLLLMRKFNVLTGGVSVQVELDHPSRRVIETVFLALPQQAEEIRQPERNFILARIEVRCNLILRVNLFLIGAGAETDKPRHRNG